MNILFPDPTWKKIFEKYKGYNLVQKYYYDEVYNKHSYRYEFDFLLGENIVKLCINDLTTTNRAGGDHLAVSHLRDRYLQIRFEYRNEPKFNFSLYEKSSILSFLDKLLFKNISLKNTVLESRFSLESNKRNVAKKLIPSLIFMNGIKNISWVKNDVIDFKTAKTYLVISTNNWIRDTEIIENLIEDSNKLFNSTIIAEKQVYYQNLNI